MAEGNDPVMTAEDDGAARRLLGRWVCEQVNGCTCGGGGDVYGHEPDCGLEPVFELQHDPTFVIIRVQIVGDMEHWETAYYVDYPDRHPSIEAAVAFGIEAYDHDDFLLAVLDGESIAAVAWQQELREPDEDLTGIAAELGLPVSEAAISPPPTDRREAMWARYGVPKTADTAQALRTIGRRQEVHPKDAIAFLYANQEAADAFAATNLEHHGHQSLGSYATADGVVGVIDIRAAQEALGHAATDPAEAD